MRLSQQAERGFMNYHLIRKLKSATVNIIKTVLELLSKKISLKYAWIKLSGQLMFVGKRFDDGVNWYSYTKHYSEELKMMENKFTTSIAKNVISFENDRIVYGNNSQIRLHPNHELLYETILKISPTSVLEIGCGGGDHLANLHFLNPKLKIYGVDLLGSQLELLNSRHKLHNFNLSLCDITISNTVLPKSDLIFTQAVLMHISEKTERFLQAIDNILKSSAQFIVLMENWTQHDFLSAIKSSRHYESSWKIYFIPSKSHPNTKIMVVSKNTELEFQLLVDYKDLLSGAPLSVH